LNNESYISSSWRRLKKKKAAMAGMVIIILSVLTGVFAYFIAPDNTPNADRQIVEIQAKHPGYKQLFLRVRKERVIASIGLFTQLLYGKEDAYTYVPINSYTVEGDSVIATKYIDEDVSERRAYHKSQLAEKDMVVRRTFLLGTDRFGRDILSRLIIGIRVSLAVGLISVLISLTIGVFLGAIAGYFGGRTDNIIMWLINVIWSIPTLLLVFGMTLALGKGFWQIFIAVGITLWVNVARLIRGQVLAIKKLEYIQAAKALGFRNSRIIFRHILPNVTGPVIVIAASNFATAIIIEAGLSFLGIGVQPPTPSWGAMIKDHYNFIITHNPMLALAPGIAIMILVLAFNLLGNGLRDAFDVRS
jgi:ABC-type dipeptide/oligopeptide/nickel transport system permease subunit